MAKKNKYTLNGLLMNNKVVLGVSILTSIFFWVVISLTVSPEDTRVIENVKVTLSQEEDSVYQAFGFEETYVDVTVKGKRHLISSGAFSSDNISVTASAGYVDSAGSQKLRLSADVVNASDVEITSLSQTSIQVFYDIPKTAKFPVSVKLSPKTTVVPDGYIYDDPIGSLSTVTVTGPATEINKIEEFQSAIEVSYPLTETTAIEGSLKSVTTSGKKAKYITFEENVEDFTATIPVLMVKEIPVSVNYINRPSKYEKEMFEVNYYPQKLKVAAAKTVLDEMESLNIGTVDFSNLTNTNNTLTFSTEKIEEVRLLDKVKEVKVDINCYPVATKSFNLTSVNIMPLNVADGMKATIKTKSISNITAVGAEKSLNKLEDSKIFAKVDLSGVTQEETSYFDAVLYIQDSDDCWIYGQYKVLVAVENDD